MKSVQTQSAILSKESSHYCECPNCQFNFGYWVDCLPFDPTRKQTLEKEFFDSYFKTGKAEGICPRCKDLITEENIYKI